MKIKKNWRAIFLKSILFFLALLLLSVLRVGPATAGQYSNSAAIFELGAGARPLGMGGAFIGLADDENATVYNPAGLAFLAGGGVNTTYEDRHGALTYNSAVGALGPVGIAGMKLSSASISVTDQYGIDTGSTTSYSSTGLIGGIGLSGSLIGRGGKATGLGLGLQVKSFQSSLQSTTGSGIGLSLSALAMFEGGGDSLFQFGVVIPSVLVADPLTSGFPVGTIKYRDGSGNIVHEEEFPNTFGVGLGFKRAPGSGMETNLAVDWRAQGGLRAGMEQRFYPAAIRFGVTGDGKLSAGGGIDLGRLGSGGVMNGVSIDGVFSWQKGLGNTWMLSFSANF